MDQYQAKSEINDLNESLEKLQNSKEPLSADKLDLQRRILDRIEELRKYIPNPPITLDQPGRPETRTYNGKKSGFSSLGECFRSIAYAETSGDCSDKRLFEARSISGLGTTTPHEGGFLLHPMFSTELLNQVYSGSDILNLCNRHSLKPPANSIHLPKINQTSRVDGSRWGGVRGYWKAEGGELTASKPEFELLELSPKKVVVLVYITEELLNDSQGLDNYIKTIGTDEIRFKVQDAVINGDGAGKPLGIMQSNCLVTQDAEGGQGASTVIYENVQKMWSRMPAKNRKTAVWLINQDIEPQLYSMSLAVGAGGSPVYMPGGGLSSAPYSTLFSRPVIPIEQAQTLGTAGDIILADMSQYALVDCGDPQVNSSIHVRFLYDESVFRITYRVDGQSLWSSALTPFKGSNTQSPFIALSSSRT